MGRQKLRRPTGFAQDGICSEPGVSYRAYYRLKKSFLKRNKQKSYSWEISRLGRLVDIHTPYGRLLRTVRVRYKDSEDYYKWTIADPRALIYCLCKHCPYLVNVLAKCARADKPFNVILYTDETTPGNELAPELTKQVQCIYWSLAEFPKWLRSRDCGWFFFGVAKTLTQKQIAGGLGGLVKQVLAVFFDPMLSFTGGITLPSAGGPAFVFRAKLGSFIQDEKAYKFMWSVKGASGLKCCMECNNIFRCPLHKLADDDYCKHVALALPHEFDQASDAEFFQAWDHLAESKNEVAPEEFHRMQQVLGITYDADALAFDPLARQIGGVRSTMWDWQHGKVGSGGMFQYVGNAFCLELEKTGTSLASLDAFTAEVKMPMNGKINLPKKFFQKRVRRKPCSHWRAFAGDTITALRVLGLYVDAEGLVEKQPALAKHCHCLQLELSILDLLMAPRDDPDKLERMMVEHHVLCLELYPFKMLKVKPHLMLHLPDQQRRFGFSQSCFPGERRHHITKLAASHSSGVDTKVVMSILRRSLMHQFSVTNKSQLEEANLPEGSIEDRVPLGLLSRFYPHLSSAPATKTARQMRYHGGQVCSGDLMVIELAGTSTLGVAHFFVSVRDRTHVLQEDSCFVVFFKCERISAREWEATKTLNMCRSRNLKSRCLYVVRRGRIVPGLPREFA